MKATIKRNLFWGLGLSLALLLISSIASYMSITDLIQSSELVRQSNEKIENLNSVLSVMKDAETGQRGYMLTGDPSFLEPYNQAKSNVSELVNLIIPSISSHDFQKKNLERLQMDI
jgi:CHASE3 domain sensor protein